MFTIFKKLTGAAVVASLVFASSSALASGSKYFEVTITNITNSISFTPIVVASHRKKLSIFELGEPASASLATIAESGNPMPLTELLESGGANVDNSLDQLLPTGLLFPGESVTVTVSAAHGARRITVASMMLPTNDGFIALNSVKAPKHGSVTYYSPGYDAGSEPNDELCTNIPGPTCGGTGRSEGDGDIVEGYVQIHRGIHGLVGGIDTDLDADVFDWRNPVAKITITRIRDHDDDDDD
jgi:hypothetical protein